MSHPPGQISGTSSSPGRRTRRSLERAMAAIRAHFREEGRAPSLGELGGRLKCSAQRVSALVDELARRGRITRTKGEAFSIRLAEAAPGSMLSDAEVIHEARSRGLVDWAAVRELGAGLDAAYKPLMKLELPLPRTFDDLLGRIDEAEAKGGRGGEEEGPKGQEAGPDAGAIAPFGPGAGGDGAAARDQEGRRGGGGARRAA